MVRIRLKHDTNDLKFYHYHYYYNMDIEIMVVVVTRMVVLFVKGVLVDIVSNRVVTMIVIEV